jgi:hypothetical protein
MKTIKMQLEELKYVENDVLTITVNPLNIFARYGSETLWNKVDQSLIVDKKHWMLCYNRIENDLNWYNPNFSAASMAGPGEDGLPGHVFITTKMMCWKYFNVTTIALDKRKGLTFLKSLKFVAEEYTKGRGWKNAGYFFHCYPHNSVNSLHLHVINLDTIGFNYFKNAHKNLSLDDIIETLTITDKKK